MSQSFFSWLMAWLLIILALYFLAQIEAGKRIVYYLLILMIVLVAVTHYKEIASIFAQGGAAGYAAPNDIIQSGTPGGTF
jgi:hypothetical protein